MSYLQKLLNNAVRLIGSFVPVMIGRVLDDSCLSEELARAPVLGEIEFKLPGHHQRSDKRVVQRLKAVRVELRPPQRKGSSLEPTYVTAIVTEEIRPPKGEEPITWVLLTNLPRHHKETGAGKSSMVSLPLGN